MDDGIKIKSREMKNQESKSCGDQERRDDATEQRSKDERMSDSVVKNNISN